MFPKGMINDVVIAVTPLALDHEQDLGALSIIGSSLAVMMAGIPFDGPVSAVRIGRKDGQLIINPTIEQIETGELNLIISGKKGSLNMIELDAREVADDILQQAFELAQQQLDMIS